MTTQPNIPPSLPSEEKKEAKQKSSIFASISNFNSSKLRKTETVVRHIIGIVDYNHGAGPDSALDDNAVKEIYDTEENVLMKAKLFSRLLKNAKYVVFHTGAGVSTAAKLPDYRGPQGVWTLRAKGYEPKFQVTLEQAKPTFTHMAIVELLKHGYLHFLVSTNVDGLHRRSGVTEDQMSELHGNIYREYCMDCGKEYLRAFDVTKVKKDRRTGRLCQNLDCNGKLRDSIINFGESLPVKELSKAEKHSAMADFVVVFGSSMMVTPASDIPSMSYNGSNNATFVIVNLQKTKYDEDARNSGGFTVGAKIDDFMKLVMKELKMEVQPFSTDSLMDSLKSELKHMRVDPHFTLYDIMGKNKKNTNTNNT